MHREDIAEYLSWVMIALMVVAGILYFFPVMSWKIAAGTAFVIGLFWAWLLSTEGNPIPLPPNVAEQNVASGEILTQGGLLLVGDQWGPGRNKGELKVAPGRVEFTVSVRGKLVSSLVLRAAAPGFDTTHLRVAVDSGFVAFFDAAWEERGLSEKSIAKDIKAVLSSSDPLHLLVRDRSGVPAGLVVGSGFGDGVYTLKAAGEEARIRFVTRPN